LKGARLLQIRFEGDVSETDIKEFRSRLLQLVVRIGKPVVSCVDSRACGPLIGEAKLMIVGLMRSDNRSLERSAVVLRAGAAVTEELQRAVDEARSPSRRAFTEPQRAVAWLTPVLSPDELAELQHFLAERV
jgi:hypothetical protein